MLAHAADLRVLTSAALQIFTAGICVWSAAIMDEPRVCCAHSVKYFSVICSTDK
jgi:hypothetical protein